MKPDYRYDYIYRLLTFSALDVLRIFNGKCFRRSYIFENRHFISYFDNYQSILVQIRKIRCRRSYLYLKYFFKVVKIKIINKRKLCIFTRKIKEFRFHINNRISFLRLSWRHFNLIIKNLSYLKRKSIFNWF